MNDSLRHAPIGVIEVTPAGTISAANGTAAEILGASRETLHGASIDDGFPDSTGGTLRDAFRDGIPEERAFKEYYPGIDRWLGVDIVPGDEQVFVYVRDRSSHREQQQRIDQLEHRLDRLETIDATMATVLRQVIDASAPKEVLQTVCNRLGQTNLYEFTWVGERDVTDDTLQVVASAGDAPDMLERIRESLADNQPLPEREAVTTGETQVVQRIAEDEWIPRPVRLAGFGRGLQSCIAIPLSYRETVYGVLCLYAAREHGFEKQERASLETLGAIAGFAINAIRQEDLLFADTVTELTVKIRDSTVPFADAAKNGDCQVSLAGAVPRDDDSLLCYLRPADDSDAVTRALRDHDAVLDVRAIGGNDDTDTESLLEVTVTGDTALATFAAWGATILSAEYSGGVARISAQVSSESDLRQLVSAVDSDVAETEVVAKQEREREPETVGAFQSALDEALTDKQRRVLRTAYLSDYFASPRGSTSEEVADALDVTGPTVLYHLRRGQRKLLESFFEVNPGTTTGAESRE